MATTRFARPLALAFAATIAAGVAPSEAAAQSFYDVKAREGGAPTQAGWTAVNLGNINNVTFTAVGNLFLADRDRGAGVNTSGASSFDNMWRDFIFADERQENVNLPAGMDIRVANLTPNSLFSVSLWAFDAVSVDPRNMTWNGVAYSFNGTDVRPNGLMEKRVNFTTMSDASGVALLEGRIGSNGDNCCNVFVNGFSITAVPEPGSIALVAFGMVGIAVVARRRRNLLQ